MNTFESRVYNYFQDKPDINRVYNLTNVENFLDFYILGNGFWFFLEVKKRLNFSIETWMKTQSNQYYTFLSLPNAYMLVDNWKALILFYKEKEEIKEMFFKRTPLKEIHDTIKCQLYGVKRNLFTDTRTDYKKKI